MFYDGTRVASVKIGTGLKMAGHGANRVMGTNLTLDALDVSDRIRVKFVNSQGFNTLRMIPAHWTLPLTSHDISGGMSGGAGSGQGQGVPGDGGGSPS